MVLAVGTDLAEIPRVEASISRFGTRFLRRIYTPAEIAYCSGRKTSAASFAARFAAKEAAAKALGTGIGRGIAWQQLEVQRHAYGPPRLVLHGPAALRAHALGVERISLSLTHTGTLAMAVVILEGTPHDVR